MAKFIPKIMTWFKKPREKINREFLYENKIGGASCIFISNIELPVDKFSHVIDIINDGITKRKNGNSTAERIFNAFSLTDGAVRYSVSEDRKAYKIEISSYPLAFY